MVIKNINDAKTNSKVLVEEQLVGNKRYTICDSYAPGIHVNLKRVTISTIDETKPDHYEEIHGLDLKDNKITSIYILNDKNHSTQDSKILNDNSGYYDEVMNGFSDLIVSSSSEFTKDSLQILELFMKKAEEIRNNKKCNTK